jgi:glucokinase
MAGDVDARAILTDAGAALGHGLAALLNVICPKLIVISGVMARSDLYLNAAWNSAKNGAIAQAARDVRLVPSRLGPLAGATGSAAMILDQVLESR